MPARCPASCVVVGGFARAAGAAVVVDAAPASAGEQAAAVKVIAWLRT